MKKLSIRARVTLWFSAALVLLLALTAFLILSVDRQIVLKTVRDNLIEAVERNVDEVEYATREEALHPAPDTDLFLPWQEGYLEIDDDYLDEVNGIYTSLCEPDGSLLYGENPIMRASSALPLTDKTVQTCESGGVRYYLFDRKLTAEGVEGLWLRGVVAQTQGNVQIGAVARISLLLMPVLALLAVVGGYLIAGRMLRPIREISAAAEEISTCGDLKRRIALKPGGDELHQLAGNFNRMMGQLETSFEKERRFTSDVSHELRTPASVIQAQCEFALEAPRTEEEYVHALESIDRQSRKMSKLINEMLAFTRLERSPDLYPQQKLDLSDLVRGVCEDLALLREKGICLRAEVADGVTVRGNPELLTRLLTNLIGNAYRYGKENGSIQVRLTAEGGDALLRVADDGIGISESDQKKIFDRFYQADPSRAAAGSGLGLAMADEIARFHDGSLTVESRLGEGSVFTFRMAECR
ncbi:MAG: HAMP domain-containing histidine kinase [Oscillospiraceae bacterium]|nr:HAMP domain-containing histidine kinase [Oscillospiraceae bacterium]MBQ2153488.1 HAMP domain-containing histidine kinase [Oscillospiraceae bacterium]